MPVKQKIGTVISHKMQKTIVVEIENRYPHPIYSKIMTKTKRGAWKQGNMQIL